VIASVHMADVGLGTAVRVLGRGSRAVEGVAGLRHADVAFATPLRKSMLPSPDFRRIALMASWEDDADLDRFLASGHPVAAALADGWRVRLAPLRAWGAWPGLPDDLTRDRHVDHEGPAAVLTLGRLQVRRAVPFLKASLKAEKAARLAPGMLWGSAMTRPPLMATCSLWADSRSLSAYAFNRSQPDHYDAIEADRAKPFHKGSAFVRFRPYGSEGGLAGDNPLPADWAAVG
jgi:hypothetical protein